MKQETQTVPQLPVFKVSLVLAGLLVVGILAWGAYYLFNEHSKAEATANALETCRRFAELANRDDPSARELIGPAPAVPAEAVEPAEAERLVAEFILHKSLRVQKVEALPAKGGQEQRFKLVLEGSAASERILVQTPDGPQPQQKVLYNADLIVKVRDGKIQGLKATLHED